MEALLNNDEHWKKRRNKSYFNNKKNNRYGVSSDVGTPSALCIRRLISPSGLQVGGLVSHLYQNKRNTNMVKLINIYILAHTKCMEKMCEMIKNPDLLEMIFSYLDPASVKAASLVSR